MKKVIILLFALTAINYATAQGCLPEGITFTTQAQVDSFQINYPTCTHILGDVMIYYDITNLSGLSNITQIDGGLTIWSTWALQNLAGLQNLDTIGNDLTIGAGYMWFGNYALTSLAGLESLTYIGGNLQISDDRELTGLSGLDNLTQVEGDFLIYACGKLENLTGLENLTSIGGNFLIDGNAVLHSLSGLDNLISIGGYLRFGLCWGCGTEPEAPHNNPRLASLTSLSNLTTIGGDLQIMGCDSLSSLSGLNSISAGTITDIYIAGNTLLSGCDVISICNYLSSPNGEIIFAGNAPGCNSQAEVEAACGIIGIEEILHTDGFSIYPNPSSSQITIETSTDPCHLSILDLSGRLILNRQVTEPETVIDISTLPRGVYVVRVWDERGVFVEKLIKQ